MSSKDGNEQNIPEEFEWTEPPRQLEWVDEFMRDIQARYLLWDKQYGGPLPIVFSEGQYSFDPFEDEYEVRDFQEVCFWNGEAIEAIGDDHVYYQYDNAYEAMVVVRENLLRALSIPRVEAGDLPTRVLAFRHPDNDWGSACTIEHGVLVNKLGWAVFVRRDLLERLNVKIPKYQW